MKGSRLDCTGFGPVRYQISFRLSSRSRRVSMASSLATESQEPVASAVTETSRPTVDRRVSTRLQPLSEMRRVRSEEQTSELQSLMRISYAVFCLKKNTKIHIQPTSCIISISFVIHT